VQHPGGREEDGAFGHREAAPHVGFGGGTGDGPDGWVETHGLGEAGVGPGELVVVGGLCIAGRGAGTEDGDGFLVEAFEGFGVAREEPEGKAEAVSRGFVSGEQGGDAFVAHLLVGHAAGALGVLTRQQHGEQITFVAVAGAALGDEPVDELVEVAARGTDAVHERQRQLVEQLGRGEKREREKAHEGIDGAGDARVDGLHFGVEHGFTDDAETEQLHVVVHVTRGAGLPGGRELAGIGADDGAIGGDAVAMEGGLREAALAHVVWILTRKQTLAENELGLLHDEAAMVMPGIGQEQFLDQIGMVGLEDVAAGGLEVNEVAELLGAGGEKGQRVEAEEVTGAEAREEAGALWIRAAGSSENARC
jgi:hypothetical protein